MSVIFSYNIESGDLTGLTTVGSGDLSASSNAKMAGTNYGISLLLDDTTANYVYNTDYASHNHTGGRFRYRFYIDPNSATWGSGEAIGLFALRGGGNNKTLVQLVRTGTTYYILAYIYNDAGTNSVTSGYSITDAPHYVEVDLIRSTNSTSNNGSLQLWIDGSSKETISGIDNYDRLAAVNAFYWGGITKPSSPSGTVYLDELVVNDDGGQIGGIWVQKFTGGLTPSGVLTGDYQPGSGSTEMTLTGGVSPSGTISKSLARKLIGAITPRGPVAYAMNIAKTLTGASTPTGTLARVLNIVRSFAGEVTSAGAYVGNKVAAGITYMTFVGAVTMAGVQTRVLNLVRTLTGAITPTGTAIKSLGRKLTGAVTMGGVLSNIKAKVATFTGAVTMGGTFARVLNLSRIFSGAVTMAGTLARRLALSRIFTGAVTMAGTLVQSIVGLYTAIVALTLRARSAALTLLERDNKLTVWTRRFGLTVKERD